MKKIILISGGSSGLGKAIAKELAADHEVFIFGHRLDELKSAAESIGCNYELADITDYQAIERLVNKVVAQKERVDCLINNAGIYLRGELKDNKPEDIRQTMEVNAVGAMFCSRAVIPQMKNQKRGLIINVVSQDGLYAKPERSVYTASKWAMTGLTKCLQTDLAKYGIRVTGLYPGRMKTNLFKAAGIKEEDFSDALSPAEAAKAVRFIIEAGDRVVIPEIGIKHLDN